MDLDQRTRLLGSRAGRIILLGDGTEIVTGHGGDDEEDDHDIDMEDRGEAEEIHDNAGSDASTKTEPDTNGETATRAQREETPAPDTKPATVASPKAETKPEEPKIMAASDSIDTKTVAEHSEQK